MKSKILFTLLVVISFTSPLTAQHARVRLNFPININIGSRGPAPFAGAVWIGPEWAWRGNRYEAVPGYWAKPMHPRAVWVPGHWKRSRRGHIWVGGYWR